MTNQADRELLAAEYRKDGFGRAADEIEKGQHEAVQRYALRAIAAARAQAQGEVVVTRNEAGAIVAVTRQDAEGRMLSVIAEAQAQGSGEVGDEDLRRCDDIAESLQEAGGPTNSMRLVALNRLLRHARTAPPSAGVDIRAAQDAAIARVADEMAAERAPVGVACPEHEARKREAAAPPPSAPVEGIIEEMRSVSADWDSDHEEHCARDVADWANRLEALAALNPTAAQDAPE